MPQKEPIDKFTSISSMSAKKNIQAVWISSILLVVSTLCLAQETKDTRRVEEETRQELKASESLQTTSVDNQEVSSDKEFFHRLLKTKFIKYEDAFTAFVKIDDIENTVESFNEQFDLLRQKGYLPDDITISTSPQKYITKGQTAFVLVKIFDFKGGVVCRLFGLNNRRAFNELRYRGILWKGFWQEPITGKEFINSINRAAQQYAE